MRVMFAVFIEGVIFIVISLLYAHTHLEPQGFCTLLTLSLDARCRACRDLRRQLIKLFPAKAPL